MDESESTSDSDAKVPDGGLLAWLRGLWRRMAGPPPQLLLSDIVAPDALPVCPRCVRVHQRTARVCLHCGETVSPWASSMPFVWIFVWGRAMHRAMRQARWSRLVMAGMLLTAADFLGSSVAAAGAYTGPLADMASPSVVRGYQAAAWVLVGAPYLAAGLRMLAKAWRLRGQWRRDGQNGAGAKGEGIETGVEEG